MFPFFYNTKLHLLKRQNIELGQEIVDNGKLKIDN